MPVMNKAMKPYNYDPAQARFPYLVTTKIDGIRFMARDDGLYSFSNKLLPNQRLQSLTSHFYPGIEGELFAGSFQKSSSIVMSDDAPLTDLVVMPFDYVEPTCPIKPYTQRLAAMRAVSAKLRRKLDGIVSVQPLMPIVISTQQELDTLLADALAVGHEGLILRTPDSLYKQGKSTPTDHYIQRIKPFDDQEGVIIAVNPYLRNDNEYLPGTTKKRSLAANKVPMALVGSFTLRLDDGTTVNCGSGLDDQQRTMYWFNKPLGQKVKFKFQACGTVDKPRSAIFLGIRHEVDCD